MVRVNTGLDAIRDFLKGEIANILIGTDGTAASKTDSSLGNQVASKSSTNTEGGTGEVTYKATLGTSENNGDTLREVGVENGSGEFQARIVHADLDKTSDLEVEYRLTETTVNP